MANYPGNLKYTKDHEWAHEQGGLVRIGITAYAVDQLGDVTLVDLPKVGQKLEVHKRFGDIESVKTVSELFAPVSGEVTEINGNLEASPELVNQGPYDQGWMVAIRPSKPGELAELMNAQEYEAFLATLDH